MERYSIISYDKLPQQVISTVALPTHLLLLYGEQPAERRHSSISPPLFITHVFSPASGHHVPRTPSGKMTFRRWISKKNRRIPVVILAHD